MLADRREDEVRALLGHVTQHRLHALEESGPAQAARSNGALGVVDLVDQGLEVRVGRVLIQERDEPVDLVLVQDAATVMTMITEVPRSGWAKIMTRGTVAMNSSRATS